MQRLFRPWQWLKTKVSNVIEDFDTTAVEFDVLKGAICLNNVRVAATALQLITEHLCCQVPLVARAITVGKASIQLNWGSGFLSEPVQIALEGVCIYLETLHSSDWDLEKAKDYIHAAKMRALQVHSEIVRFGYKEGAGFLHSLLATVLDNLELKGSGLQCFLEDSASMHMDAEPHPFTLGVGVIGVEMKRREGVDRSKKGVVLRHLFLEQPYAFLDNGVGAAAAASAGTGSSGTAAESRTDSSSSSPQTRGMSAGSAGSSKILLGSNHEWILRPSPTLHFEIGLLQCLSVSHVEPRPKDGFVRQTTPPAGVSKREGMVHERDIAELADLLHKDDEKDSDTTINSQDQLTLPLPRSAIVIAMGPYATEVDLDSHRPRGAELVLSPKHVECLLALAAFAGLGYGAVLSGVSAQHTLPSKAELKDYGEKWLKATLLEDKGLPEELELLEFEYKHPLSVIEQAREDEIHGVSTEIGELNVDGSAKNSRSCNQQGCHPFFESNYLRAKLVGRRWCAHHMQGAEVSIENASFQETAQLIHETLTVRNPRWQHSWRELCQAKVPLLVVAANIHRLCVNIMLEDDEALSAGVSTSSINSGSSASSYPRKQHPNYLSFSMDQILLSVIEKDKDFSLAQASLVEFRVEDYYGPWKLRQLARHAQRALHTPQRRVLVHSGGHPGTTRVLGVQHKSELFVAVGRRKHKRLDNEPDGTLQLRSFGELNVYLPPIQLAVLCVTMFPPKVRHHLSSCLGGEPWKKGAPETVLEMARRGMEARSEIWKHYSEGTSDSWFLLVNLQPVHLLMPVPGQQAFEESSSPHADPSPNSFQQEGLRHMLKEEGNEVIDICLGRMTASSKLLPRKSTNAKSPRGSMAKKTFQEKLDAYYDEYAAEISSFSIRRRQAKVPKGREILPDTTMGVKLKICHWAWTWVGLPESVMEVDAPAFEIDLASPDIETCIELLAEMHWVMTDLTAQAAEKAQTFAKVHLHRLAEKARTQSGFYGKNLRHNHQNAFKTDKSEGYKLMNLKFDSRDVNMKISLPKAPNEVWPEQLEVTLNGIMLSGFLCIDASMECSISVESLEITGTGESGVKLYSSDREWQREARLARKSAAMMRKAACNVSMETGEPLNTPRSQFEHIRIVWKLEVNVEQEWRFAVSIAVTEPTMMIWWRTLAGLSRLFARCSKQVSFLKTVLNEQVLVDQVKHKTLRYATPLRKLGNFFWMFPERFSFSFHVARAQILVPLKIIDEIGPVSPLLRIVMSPRTYLERSSKMGETWKSHSSACKFSADLLLPDRAGLKLSADAIDPNPWTWITSGARVTAFSLLSPCRLHSDCKIQRARRISVHLVSEPLEISVFPATRQLLTDAGLALVTFAARVLEERWQSKDVRSRNLEKKSPEVRQHEIPEEEQTKPVNHKKIVRGPSVTFQDEDASSNSSKGSSVAVSDARTSVSLPARLSGNIRSSSSKPTLLAFDGDGPPNVNAGSTLDDVEWFVRSISHFAFDIARMTTRNCEFEVLVRSDNVALHFSDAPGGAQPLSAIVSVEDLSFHVQHSGPDQDPNADSDPEFLPELILPPAQYRWKTAFESMVRAQALDALSLQVEPIMEPVHISWQLKKHWKGDGAANLLPSGEFTMSWVNLTLPLGVFYAVKLWMRAEGLLKRTKEEESSPERVMGHVAPELAHRTKTPPRTPRSITPRKSEKHRTLPTRLLSSASLTDVTTPERLDAESPGVLPNFRRELFGCDVVNQLGLPIAVRRTDKQSTRWCVVNPGKLQVAEDGGAQADVSESSAAAKVPPMIIRGTFRGMIFEAQSVNELQVPQFEVIQLKLPPTMEQYQRDHEKPRYGLAAAGDRGQLLSLILRAVPQQLGQGCSLLISTTLMVRNNTGFNLAWTLPTPDLGQDNSCVKELTSDSLHEVDMSTAHDTNNPVYRVVSAGKQITNHAAHSLAHVGETVAPTFTHAAAAAGEYVSDAAMGAIYGHSPRGISSRWLTPSTDDNQGDQGESGAPSQTSGQAASSCDLPPMILGAYQRKPLPLSWLAAASDPSRGHLLHLSLEDSDSSTQVLPSETLLSLGAFDFSMSHRDAEQQVQLGGSLLKLQDGAPEPNPVHLCCTLTVGLLADRACCLEIVVSSTFVLVNNLPVRITATTCIQAVEQSKRQLDVACTAKQYLAADLIQVDMEACPLCNNLFMFDAKLCQKCGVAQDAGSFYRSEMTLKTEEPFMSTEEFTVIAFPYNPILASQSSSRSSWRIGKSGSQPFSGKVGKMMEKQNALALNVLCSSAFEHDAPQMQINAADPWLETLSWFHPSEWKTYRRAFTVYAKCWVENCSTEGVWFRAAGARGVAASSVELYVPPNDTRLLPAHLAATGKMSISTKEKARHRQVDYLRWQRTGRRRNVHKVKTLHINLGDSKVLLAATVNDGPRYSRRTLVIKLSDYLTLENRMDLPIHCWVPMNYRIPKRLRVYKCCSKAVAEQLVETEMKEVILLPKSKSRVDTEAPRFRIAANHLEEDRKSPRNHAHDVEGGYPSEPGESKSPSERLGVSTSTEWVTGWIPRMGGGRTRGVQDIDTERPTSFQVRFCMDLTASGPKYQNLRVSVQKLDQGAATHVIFEPGEPRYVIWNQTSLRVNVGQQGPGTLESLEPKEKLEFVWYDPDGTLKLEVKWNTSGSLNKSETSAISSHTMVGRMAQGVKNLTIPTSQQAGLEDQPQVVREFDAALGLELLRIIAKDPNKKTLYRTGTLVGAPVTTISRMIGMGHTFSGQATTDDGDRTGLGSRPGLHLYMEGLGTSLLDASPLQIVYFAIDEVTMHVLPSSSQRQTRRHAEEDEVPLLRMNSTVSVSTETSLATAVSGGTCATGATGATGATDATGVSRGKKKEFGTLPDMILGLVRLVPSVDVRVSVLNLQVDSHIPGGFFDCSLRPLHGRSHLFRAFHCLNENTASLVRNNRSAQRSFSGRLDSPVSTPGTPKPIKKMKTPGRPPMLNFEINGCNLMARPTGGGAIMIKDCRADLDKVTVNIDEALLVGLSAYYCRVAVYFNLPPFSDVHHASSSEDGPAVDLNPITSKMPIDAHKLGQSWLLTVEETMKIEDNTSYLSIRLMESANPYVEGLQRDEHVSMLLGMVMPLYAAAFFQPAMLSHQTRMLVQERICMNLLEMFKLLNEHFVAPLEQRIGLFLWISFDWLGNPRKLFFGILVGFRELFMQPYRNYKKAGIKGFFLGIPRGIVICLCSVFGSIFDSLARLINAIFKSIDRVLRYVHKKVGLENISRKGTSILSLSRTPVNKRDGLRRGTLLALLQCRTVFRNMNHIIRVFLQRGRQEYRCALLYLLVFVITIVLTFCLGLVEAVLLFLYNVLQGLVISLYRRSAEDVCDWDPMQLVALEMPTPIRPCPQRDEVSVGGTRSSMVAPFAYLPALVREQLDPDEELVPPWQWRRWSGGDDDVRDTVFAALWCGSRDHLDNETKILYQTGSHIALLRISDFHITSKGRPRKPKAAYTTLWRIHRPSVEDLQLTSKDGGWMLHVVSKGSHHHRTQTAFFASKDQAFRALELLAQEMDHSAPTEIGQ